MRFYLDQDTDVGVCKRTLTPAGHECWTASQAGNATVSDQDQGLYAQAKGAVLVTHDRRFANTRRHPIWAQLIFLDCEQPDGPDVLRDHLANVVAILERHSDAWVRVHPAGIELQTTE